MEIDSVVNSNKILNNPQCFNNQLFRNKPHLIYSNKGICFTTSSNTNKSEAEIPFINKTKIFRSTMSSYLDSDLEYRFRNTVIDFQIKDQYERIDQLKSNIYKTPIVSFDNVRREIDDFRVQKKEQARRLAEQVSSQIFKKDSSLGFRRKILDLSDTDTQKLKKIFERGRGADLNEVVSVLDNIELRKKDLQCLRPMTQLNDEVINFYMALLEQRSRTYQSKKNALNISHTDSKPNTSASYPLKAIFFNTFFFPKLAGRQKHSYNYSSVRRQTRRKKVDVFALDRVFVPVHVGESHQCLASIDMNRHCVEYYDSLFGKQNWQWPVEVLSRWVLDEQKDKKSGEKAIVAGAKMNIEQPPQTSRIFKPGEIPVQLNGSDCGVFTCKFAEYLSSNSPLDFSQADMKKFRQRMLIEIIDKKLDYEYSENLD